MASFLLHGIPVSAGIAIGRAHLLASAALEVQHYLIETEQIEAEVLRLQTATAQVEQELRTLSSKLPKNAPAELAAFIEVHVLILTDPMISNLPLEMIRERHYNAEWALLTQIDELAAQFAEISDQYLRERSNDVRQVGERILKILRGSAIHLPDRTIDIPIIIVAHDISPADMLQFRQQSFHGFLTDLGGQNSHTAIVARSLGIPAVVGVSNASTLIEQEDWVIIDGELGVIIVNPDPQILNEYRLRQTAQIRERKKLAKLKKTPAITQDGVEIELHANIELADDCAVALDNGATGIGLFRSEFLFLGRETPPTEDEQFKVYKSTVVAMKGRPVTIRTLDIGADKPLDSQNIILSTQYNPALGLRAIRYCLSEPEMFAIQLRALLRASAFGPIKILIPMLAHVSEIEQTLAMIEQAKLELRGSKIKFDPLTPIGAMIEIPAAALSLPAFIKRLDFLSIGTNDLIQYTLAIDRVDHEVAHLYDPLHPAVLQLLSLIISTANKANKPVSVCGEMAGDIQFTRLLMGMGLRNFSMHPTQLLAVKYQILNSNYTSLVPVIKKLLRTTEPTKVQALMQQLQIV